MFRYLLLNAVRCHPLLLSSTLPHSASPPLSLLSGIFVQVSPEITLPYLTDSLGQNDFHLDNSGRQNHCIAPRRDPKCPRCYFPIQFHCSKHCHSAKYLTFSDFLWQHWRKLVCSVLYHPALPAEGLWWFYRPNTGVHQHTECAKCQQNPGGHWGNHVQFADKNVTAGLRSLDIDFVRLGDLKHVF